MPAGHDLAPAWVAPSQMWWLRRNCRASNPFSRTRRHGRNPKFAKGQNFKSDVGPHMDDFQDALDKVFDAVGSAAKALPKVWGELEKIKDNLEAAGRD